MSEFGIRLLDKAWKECELAMKPYMLIDRSLTLQDFSNTLSLQRNKSEKSLLHINPVFQVPSDFKIKHRYTVMKVLVESVTNQLHHDHKSHRESSSRIVQLLMLKDKLHDCYVVKLSFEDEALKYLDIVKGLNDKDDYVLKICKGLQNSVMFHYSIHFADYVKNGSKWSWPTWDIIDRQLESMDGSKKKNSCSMMISLNGRGHSTSKVSPHIISMSLPSVACKRSRSIFEESSETMIVAGNINYCVPKSWKLK